MIERPPLRPAPGQAPGAFLRELGRLEDGGAEQVWPIATAALAFARMSHPDTDPAPYDQHLADLAEAARGHSSSLEGHLDALRTVLVGELGYRGDRDRYDDLANGDLIRVIDRRLGLPVALGILWIHAARARGLRAVGLGFPGHFLVHLVAEGARAIIDPFSDGAVRSAADLRHLLKQLHGEAVELRPSHYAPVSDRAVLIRLQNNTKIRLLQAGRGLDATVVIERMLMLAPRDADLWREFAQIQAHVGWLSAALEAAQQSLAVAADSQQRQAAAQLVQQIKRSLG